jgi:hypothetical protein
MSAEGIFANHGLIGLSLPSLETTTRLTLEKCARHCFCDRELNSIGFCPRVGERSGQDASIGFQRGCGIGTRL